MEGNDILTNITQLLVSAADRHGDRIAVRLGHERVSYRELLAEAEGYARLLRDRGVEAGDRVALALPNSTAFPAAFYGALLSGASVVPMNPLLKAGEARYYLEDSGARLVVTEEDGGTREAAAALGVPVIVPGRGDRDAEPDGAVPVPRAADDTAVILYTSGTTGRPKGAELTHANLTANATSFATTVAQAGPEDVFLGCLPLFHVFGLTCNLLTCAITGASLTLTARFQGGNILDIMERDGVTVFAGVPTMYGILLQERQTRADVDLSRLRLCLSGGAAMPVELLNRFEGAFGCMILEGYGQSESSGVTAFNQPGRPRKAGSIGFPIEGMHIRLVDPAGNEVEPGAVGEVAVRGNGVMKGYWRQPDATAEAIPDGWLRSGDLATQDPDGYYRIVDRKKSVIIRGGYNVYPREIEEVLYQHPSVLEAVVVGIPDERMGEEVGAAVVARPGTADPEELRQWVKDRVAPYKYPRHVWFVDQVPKGPSGKPLRREIELPPTLRDSTR
jgi:long-chain acyl-CoA synthetase